MTENERLQRLKQETMDEVSAGRAYLKAAVCALTLFHEWKDDATAQRFFRELEEIDGRIQLLCVRISDTRSQQTKATSDRKKPGGLTMRNISRIRKLETALRSKLHLPIIASSREEAEKKVSRFRQQHPHDPVPRVIVAAPIKKPLNAGLSE
jgi:hypothetical protein